MSQQGYSVARFAPFWHVVEREVDGRKEHIVVDTSTGEGRLPVKVFGPATKAQCMQWARAEAMLYLTIKGTFVTN